MLLSLFHTCGILQEGFCTLLLERLCFWPFMLCRTFSWLWPRILPVACPWTPWKRDRTGELFRGITVEVTTLEDVIAHCLKCLDTSTSDVKGKVSCRDLTKRSTTSLGSATIDCLDLTCQARDERESWSITAKDVYPWRESNVSIISLVRLPTCVSRGEMPDQYRRFVKSSRMPGMCNAWDWHSEGRGFGRDNGTPDFVFPRGRNKLLSTEHNGVNTHKRPRYFLPHLSLLSCSSTTRTRQVFRCVSWYDWQAY